MSITILEGSTFCICDELGDIGGWPTSGFFADDTRFLSILRLSINGRRPLLLSSDKVDYFSAAFYLRNAPLDGLEQDEISIIRERFIGEAMQDRLLVQNVGMRPVAFDLSLEVACDFADIFAVKDYDFALGDPANAAPLPPLVEPRFDNENNQFLLADETGIPAKTQVIFSREGRTEGARITYRIELEPRGRWDLRVDIVPSPEGEQVMPRLVERRFGDEIAR
ncbi:MAG TPA: glycogen debranching N-terminal domain-containing protein, partial [Gaiellaceae bacterium]|nr:glycogen debranching N-terminal domain-containing protein [Gaiellaceae bacterium]